MAYQPELKKIAKVMKKQGHLLRKNESVKRLLTPPLKISYRSAKKKNKAAIPCKRCQDQFTKSSKVRLSWKI